MRSWNPCLFHFFWSIPVVHSGTEVVPHVASRSLSGWPLCPFGTSHVLVMASTQKCYLQSLYLLLNLNTSWKISPEKFIWIIFILGYGGSLRGCSTVSQWLCHYVAIYTVALFCCVRDTWMQSCVPRMSTWGAPHPCEAVCLFSWNLLLPFLLPCTFHMCSPWGWLSLPAPCHWILPTPLGSLCYYDAHSTDEDTE